MSMRQSMRQSMRHAPPPSGEPSPAQPSLPAPYGLPIAVPISAGPAVAPPRGARWRSLGCAFLAGVACTLVCGCAGLAGLAVLAGRSLGGSLSALQATATAGTPAALPAIPATPAGGGPATPAPGDLVAAGTLVFTNSNAGPFSDAVTVRPAGFRCLEYAGAGDRVRLTLAPHGQPGDTARVPCRLDIPAASAAQFAHGLPPDALLGSCPVWGVCYDNPQAFTIVGR